MYRLGKLNLANSNSIFTTRLCFTWLHTVIFLKSRRTLGRATNIDFSWLCLSLRKFSALKCAVTTRLKIQTLLILFSDHSDIESSVLIGQESAWSAWWSRGTRTPTRHSTRFETGSSSRTATGTNKLGECNVLKIKTS